MSVQGDRLVSLTDMERELRETVRAFDGGFQETHDAIADLRQRIRALPPVDLGALLCPCHGAGEIDQGENAYAYNCTGPGCLATPAEATPVVVDEVPF